MEELDKEVEKLRAENQSLREYLSEVADGAIGCYDAEIGELLCSDCERHGDEIHKCSFITREVYMEIKQRAGVGHGGN